MRQFQLFTKTQKDISAQELSPGAQYLMRGGFIDKVAAGIHTMLPLGFRVLKNIENIIAEEMDALGAQRVLMPALTPKANWEITNRWLELDVLYKVKSQQESEYALGATHEEIVTPMAQRFTFSYKDFPFSVYQIQTKFRDELRAKSGLLRGREFMMKDLYSFHIDSKDCNEFYEKVKEAYFAIYKKTGLAQSTYLTLASGGTFSKFSHEFQTVTDVGEDTVYICDKCGLAINREIKSEYPKCPECAGADFDEKKSIEVGNIFKLGTKYSGAFNFTAAGPEGQNLPVLMNCYGIGLTRLIGTVAEIHHDDHGIIWPDEIAPFRVHLIALSAKDSQVNAKIAAACDRIYLDLQKKKVEVIYDDRPALSAGEKFNDADLLGIPFRVVVSAKTLEKESVEVKRRDSKDASLIKMGEIAKFNF